MKTYAKRFFKVLQFETITTGKRLYKSILTDSNEVDYDTMGQNDYNELHIVPSIKEIRRGLPTRSHWLSETAG